MTKENVKSIPHLVYVGTYTTKGSEGIYIYQMDPSSGALKPIGKATGIDNPSFLTVHTNQRYLYAINEVHQPEGAVSAFARDAKTGALTLLNTQPSHGTSPCHVCVDQTGHVAIVANYSSGSVAAYPIQEDGTLGEASDVIQHHGSSIHPQRQSGPHAHSTTIDPGNRYAFVADLGLDKIMIYQLDVDAGKLKPNPKMPWTKVKAGAGPRHFAFHPQGPFAYVIDELDSTITAFEYQAAWGTLEIQQIVSTLPVDFQGQNTCADVHITPDGKFLYGSNRGHDSIVIYKINENGTLTHVGHEPTQGRNPRNFALDPSGTYLFAANQDTDTIVTFRIDQQTGKLAPTGHVTEVPTPVCVKILP
jgi:6-phosphogluconolactonase